VEEKERMNKCDDDGREEGRGAMEGREVNYECQG